MKAGFVSAAEASGFFAKTASYFVGTNRAMAASLPGFIGTGVAGQVAAGAMMAIAAAAVLYGAYQVASKLKDVAVDVCAYRNEKYLHIIKKAVTCYQVNSLNLSNLNVN